METWCYASNYYNPSIQGCCGNSTYTKASSFCQDGTNKVLSFCDGEPYDQFHFCQDSPNWIQPLCGTQTYVASQRCTNDVVETSCGSGWYNSNSNYCVDGTVTTAKGEFTDDRNSKTYKYVTIGTQTWMAENLNFAVGSSMCYGNNSANCETYGRLYKWSAAISACPSGWGLPSSAELSALVNFAGGYDLAGKSLKAKDGWVNYPGQSSNANGDDIYGFTALPGGEGSSDGNSFSTINNVGHWWSSTEQTAGSTLAYVLQMFPSGGADVSAGTVTGGLKENYYSIRCIKR
jgi:uncharacterized protein (TIGR02145 family)